MPDTGGTLRILPADKTDIKSFGLYPVTLEINGRAVDPIDQPIRLDAGRYDLRLTSKPGLSSPTLSVQISDGEDLTIFARTEKGYNLLLRLIGLPIFATVGLVAYLAEYGPDLIASLILLLIPALFFVVWVAVNSIGEKAYSLVPCRQRSATTFLIVELPAEEYSSGPAAPTPSSIYLDGWRLGYIAQRLPVPPGVHTVQLRGWFGKSAPIRVEFLEGETIRLVCRENFAALWIPAVAILGLGVVGFIVSWHYVSAAPLFIALAIATPIAVFVMATMETLKFSTDGLHPTRRRRRRRIIKWRTGRARAENRL